MPRPSASPSSASSRFPAIPPFCCCAAATPPCCFARTPSSRPCTRRRCKTCSAIPRGVGLFLELTLPDLSPARHRLARRGWRLLYELEDAEFDREEIWLHDPDGYLLVLGTAPGNR